MDNLKVDGRGDRVSRVLVLWCLDWPVVTAGADPEQPAAVVDRGRIVSATQAARSAGVRRGQRLRDAQRAYPDMVVLDDDPAAQARLFEQVVTLVESQCPRVEVVRPGVAAMAARGPARYFGGEQQAAEVVRTTVAEQGYQCAVGIADGTFAALLAAREPPYGLVVPDGLTPAYLAGHPVAVLDRPDLVSMLVRLGLRTLGDFAALPAGDVLARFGTDGAEAHRLASGLAARPPATRLPAEDLSATITFDPALDAEPVVFAARGLAEDLHAKLALHGLACERVLIEVHTEDGRTRSRLWRHDGLLSAAAVAERVRWQLDAWRTLEPGSAEALIGGIDLLRLSPDQLVVDDGRQLSLWGRGVVDEQVERAAARIQAMLGHTAVTRPVLGGGLGPGDRVVRVPWGDHGEPAHAADLPWPGQVPAPAPAVVLSDPVPVNVTDARGSLVAVTARCTVSSPPARLSGLPGRAAALDIVGWTGPWPALEQWWDRTAGRRRARFQVTTSDGRAWLLLLDRGAWLVEAGYD